MDMIIIIVGFSAILNFETTTDQPNVYVIQTSSDTFPPRSRSRRTKTRLLTRYLITWRDELLVQVSRPPKMFIKVPRPCLDHVPPSWRDVKSSLVASLVSKSMVLYKSMQ